MMALVMRRVSQVLRAVGPVVGLAALCSGCSEGPFLQTEEFLTNGEEAEVYMGGGCISVQEGNGMGGGTAPVLGAGGEEGEPVSGWSVSYEGTGKSVHFLVTDGAGEVLAERDYDSEWLLSGQREEISVDVSGGKKRFLHWGGAKCQDTRTPDPI
jgi:hypothetical protein